MSHLPFSVFKRKNRRFYYVQFKGNNGEYLPAVSTKQTEESFAIEISFQWYREGKPIAGGGIIKPSLRDALRDVKDSSEAEFICRELKRQGLLKAYALSGSKQAVDFGTFLQNFWDYDNSPYIKEKLRKNHGIHRNYTLGQKFIAEKYWMPVFRGRVLGEITRGDIENFADALTAKSLSAGRKNIIIKAGTIPLRWAASKEMVEKDITRGITWFSGQIKERQILSPEIAHAIFLMQWPNDRAKLANMLAAVTGLRAGEILGLQVQDLGKECLYIRHSWNCRDHLKTTKNNEVRIVEVPFPALIDDLLNLAKRNPHGVSMDSFVFWAGKSSSKPMESVLFLSGLREALVKAGMGKRTASVYVFHGWRHFFTTHMRDRLNRKLLKSQTGHKTDAMADHYSDHLLDGDRVKIRQAQMEVFGGLVPVSASGLLNQPSSRELARENADDYNYGEKDG
jgi:integrase